MKTSIRKMTWGLLTAMLIPLTLQAAGADKRVTERLDSQRFQYTVLNDGDVKATVKLNNGRTQLLFITSGTEKLGKLEVRQVWSVGYKGQLSAAIMRNMLHRSAKLKVGAWEITPDEDKAIFAAKIPADLDANSLIRVIFAVGESADELEKDVTDDDDL